MMKSTKNPIIIEAVFRVIEEGIRFEGIDISYP